MLRRDRQIRMQIHQLMDACLFAMSFWLAYQLRANASIIEALGMPPIENPFKDFAWLLVVLIPAAPLILEAQGFYERPLLCSRVTTAWQLFKGCIITTIGLILALFLSRMLIARWVIVWFGATSFVLVFVKEEVLRFIFKSKLAQDQIKRHFVLVGTGEETRRIR